MGVQPQSVCLSAPDEIMPASLGNVPRFPETIREREIRGICSAVSQRSLPSESGGGVSEQKPPFTTPAAFCTLRQCHLSVCRLIKAGGDGKELIS